MLIIAIGDCYLGNVLTSGPEAEPDSLINTKII